MKKILVYSHDTFGLGNIRRMLAISQHLVACDPETCVLIASGSPMLHAFRLAPRLDYLKLPCLTRNLDGEYTTKSLGLDVERTLRLRANLLLSAVLDFEPDLILVDKKPYGVGNELRPALELSQRRAERPRLVLLLRDILDSPDATISVWQKNGYHDAIQALYDMVLVVGSPEIFDIREEYRFPSASAAKVRYCGFIGRERGRQSRADLRSQLSIGSSDKLVLITPGGGEDGAHICGAYLEGLAAQPQPPEHHSLLICGPELPARQRERIASFAAQTPRVTILEFTDDMMGCMEAADVVVSMAGYNTICELLTLKKRAITVPRIAPVQEQWIRAQRMMAKGLLRAIHPAQLTPQRLIATVREETAKCNVHPRGWYQVDLNGLHRIAEWVGDLTWRRGDPDGVRAPRWAEVR